MTSTYMPGPVTFRNQKDFYCTPRNFRKCGES